MNKVILMGRLTDDPKIAKGKNDLIVARYALAVQRKIKNDKGEYDSDFINCVAFGKAAEFSEKYFHKGQKVLVSGRIQTGSYINKDGQKVYTTDVILEDQEFAESKKEGQVKIANEEVEDNGFTDMSVSTDDVLFGD